MKSKNEISKIYLEKFHQMYWTCAVIFLAYVFFITGIISKICQARNEENVDYDFPDDSDIENNIVECSNEFEYDERSEDEDDEKKDGEN